MEFEISRIQVPSSIDGKKQKDAAAANLSQVAAARESLNNSFDSFDDILESSDEDLKASSHSLFGSGNLGRITPPSKHPSISHIDSPNSNALDILVPAEPLHASKKLSLKGDTLRALMEFDEADNGASNAKSNVLKTVNFSSASQSNATLKNGTANAAPAATFTPASGEGRDRITLDAADSLLEAAGSRRSQRRKKSSSTVDDEQSDSIDLLSMMGFGESKASPPKVKATLPTNETTVSFLPTSVGSLQPAPQLAANEVPKSIDAKSLLSKHLPQKSEEDIPSFLLQSSGSTRRRGNDSKRNGEGHISKLVQQTLQQPHVLTRQAEPTLAPAQESNAMVPAKVPATSEKLGILDILQKTAPAATSVETSPAKPTTVEKSLRAPLELDKSTPVAALERSESLSSVEVLLSSDTDDDDLDNTRDSKSSKPAKSSHRQADRKLEVENAQLKEALKKIELQLEQLKSELASTNMSRETEQKEEAKLEAEAALNKLKNEHLQEMQQVISSVESSQQLKDLIENVSMTSLKVDVMRGQFADEMTTRLNIKEEQLQEKESHLKSLEEKILNELKALEAERSSIAALRSHMETQLLDNLKSKEQEQAFIIKEKEELKEKLATFEVQKTASLFQVESERAQLRIAQEELERNKKKNDQELLEVP